MVINAIPPWDHNGLLPAIDWNDPTRGDRSPYVVSIIELIERFGTSDSRRQLLAGLLEFRAELHRAGIDRGHQWINGSFAEDIETSELRSPGDIDVVTFLYVPVTEYSAHALMGNHPDLFDHNSLRMRFRVDAYFVQLNDITPEEIVRASTYWYSLWSHTKNGQWKGYLQIDLSGSDDNQARLLLGDLEDGK